MTQEIFLLTLTAASVGFIHTILGPDHYVPFIAMAKAGKWSMLKTTWITIACGIGHVSSSIILGIIGIALGVAIVKLEFIESIRGEIASWLLISFGLIYLIWGIRKEYRNKPHTHFHAHSNGEIHTHKHVHKDDHSHVHISGEKKKNITPWVLFTIFIFGPCEALIPILMYPAALESKLGLVIVTAVFGITTIITMLAVVLISLYGLTHIAHTRVHQYTHALAGGLIFLCGIAIKFIGV